MHLKSLTLKGFKSFADRSQLQFEPGVTVVVGPNGSGKSNISDAVLWVLGEQSAKALRGHAMEDVIFAGSSGRQPVGVAEVDLVLDNEDGTLPLEFTEVTITRRMFRNGESEYLVNQSPCRLMDVQELLHDTGLGRDTHSIISQGRIDEVLNSRPEDRRSLIEEAAGVLKHKKRKERALRKLSAMEAHVERARDVLAEIDRQLRPLQRQADRAARYSELKSELHAIEVSLAVDELRALQARWDTIVKRENEQEAEAELLRYRLTEKERELARFQSLLEEKGLFVGDLSEQRRRLQSILERLNSGLLLLEEKGKNLVERLSELRSKVYASESRLAKRAEDLEALTEQRTGSDAQLKALYQGLSELRREAEGIKKERLAAEEGLNAANAAIRRTRKELDDARSELAALEQSLSAFKLETELLTDRAETVRGQRASVAATLSGRRSRLEQVEASLARARKEAALADSDVDKRVRVLDTRRKELGERRDRHAGIRAEIRALEEIDRAFQSATPALAWVMSKDRELEGLIGPLADHVHADEGMERLLEHSLGGDLFCLLVDDRAAAETVARMLQEHDAGDISLMPTDGAEPRHAATPDVGMPLMSAVTCDPSIRPAIASLVGDVYVVDTLDEALAASAADETGARFGTPSGQLVWPNGKVTLGPAQDSASGVLSRKRRINELRDDEAAAGATVGEAEAAEAAAVEALAAAQQDALELGQRIAALTGERDSTVEDVARLEGSLTGLDAEAASMFERLEEIASRTAKDTPAHGQLQRAIRDAERELERLEEEAAQRRDERDARFRAEAAVGERLSACQVDIAAVSEREVHLKRQIAAITSEVTEVEETLRHSRRTEEALELLRDRIQPVHELYAALLERAEHWAVKLRDRARFEQADSESLRDTMHAAQEAVREVQAEIEERQGDVGRTMVEKGQLEIQVTAAVARIVEDLDTPLERALEMPELEEPSAARDRGRRLKERLADIGPVNAVALEEYGALKTRRDFMADQVEDLVGSRKSLQRIVAAIDRKMRDRFLETFEQVDGHFQQIFSVLFPGGSAALSLTEPDDPETTGVEVVAQPLGKKLSKMTLMSGGEKSLTALALLFAVYRTRPCPFYVLDEVEAALDDANLRRFVAFVDSLRGHTQFVVVTHQRRTMEMADVLYGVSMQADGVSRVVSQRLDRASATPQGTDTEHAVV